MITTAVCLGKFSSSVNDISKTLYYRDLVDQVSVTITWAHPHPSASWSLSEPITHQSARLSPLSFRTPNPKGPTRSSTKFRALY